MSHGAYCRYNGITWDCRCSEAPRTPRAEQMTLVEFLELILTADYDFREIGHLPGVSGRKEILKQHIAKLRKAEPPAPSHPFWSGGAPS